MLSNPAHKQDCPTSTVPTGASQERGQRGILSDPVEEFHASRWPRRITTGREKQGGSGLFAVYEAIKNLIAFLKKISKFGQ